MDSEIKKRGNFLFNDICSKKKKFKNFFSVDFFEKNIFCEVCGRTNLDVMCFCGNCDISLDTHSNCNKTDEKHTHVIKQDNLKEQAVALFQKFLSSLIFSEKNNNSESYLFDKLGVTSDFVKFFHDFFETEILKKANSISMKIQKSLEYDKKYFKLTTNSIVTHSSDFALDVKFRYGFKISNPFNFYEKYLNMELNNVYSRVVYRKNTEFFIRTSDNNTTLNNLTIDEIQDGDYFAIHKTLQNYNIIIIFDMLNYRCYISETLNEIKNIITELDLLFNIKLHDPVFHNFTGVLSTKTKAHLSKSFFIIFIKHPIFAEYWNVKDADTGVNNYNFVYSENPEQQRSDIDEYIKVSIDFVEKYDVLENIWDIKFEGNYIKHFIPFIAMMISLIKKMDNLMFSVQFKSYIAEEEKFMKQIVNGNITNVDKYSIIVSSGKTSRKQTYLESIKCYMGEQYESLGNYTKHVTSNYRSVTTQKPIKTNLNNDHVQDMLTIYRWIMFYDSLSINHIFQSKIKVIDTPMLLYTVKNNELSLNNTIVDLLNIVEKNLPHKKQLITNISLIPQTFTIISSDTKKKILSTDDVKGNDGKKFIDVWFLEYPHGGNEQGLILSKGIPKREGIKPHTTNTGQYNSEHNDLLSAFTNSELSKISFFTLDNILSFFPKTNERYNYIRTSSLYEFVLEYYFAKKDRYDELSKNRESLSKKETEELENLDDTYNIIINEISTMLSQHLWDIPEGDERLKYLDSIDIEIQQDLFQHIFNVKILFFVYDDKQKKYVFTYPRHKAWYAINTTYNDVMFILRSKSGKLEVPLFFKDESENQQYREITYRLPNKGLIKKFSTEVSVSTNKTVETVTYNTIKNYWHDTVVMGQFINTDGKCFGFRLHDGKIIIDVHIEPQCPMFHVGNENGDNGMYISLNDSISEFESENNVQMYRNLSNLYTTDETIFKIIPKVKKSKKYNIMEIYEKNRFEKQKHSVFFKVILTVWVYWISEDEDFISLKGNTIFDKDNQTFSNVQESYYDTMEKLLVKSKDFFNTILHESDVLSDYESLTNNNIFKLISMPLFVDLDDLSDFLEKNYSSIYKPIENSNNMSEYKFLIKNKKEEYVQYFIDEIKIMLKAPPEFFKSFVTSDFEIDLIKQPSNQIVGFSNLQRKLEKKTNRESLDNDRESMQFLQTSRHVGYASENTFYSTSIINVNILKEHEIVITSYNDSNYIIRTTANGNIETARYICSLWKKERKIASFIETSTEIIDYTLMEIVNDKIELANRSITDSGYFILGYEDDRIPRYAAMLPI